MFCIYFCMSRNYRDQIRYSKLHFVTPLWQRVFSGKPFFPFTEKNVTWDTFYPFTSLIAKQLLFKLKHHTPFIVCDRFYGKKPIKLASCHVHVKFASHTSSCGVAQKIINKCDITYTFATIMLIIDIIVERG